MGAVHADAIPVPRTTMATAFCTARESVSSTTAQGQDAATARLTPQFKEGGEGGSREAMGAVHADAIPVPRTTMATAFCTARESVSSTTAQGQDAATARLTPPMQPKALDVL